LNRIPFDANQARSRDCNAQKPEQANLKVCFAFPEQFRVLRSLICAGLRLCKEPDPPLSQAVIVQSLWPRHSSHNLMNFWRT
jgi:hypothetical protein